MVFRRSPGIRALSLGSLLLFTALAGYHLDSGGSFLSGGGVVLGALLLFSIAAVLLNLGDRYRIDDEGISYANPILSRFGIRLGRRVLWSEVTSVREHRGIAHGFREISPSALFLEVTGGPRFVIDSVEEMEEVRRLISAHLGARPGNAAASSPRAI